ncbi:NAD(P)/FAD-dependent oxidoreductase [Microtetraspora fusca]|uniref:NAD(P)/FAD-dependent oxidoreductase n=1 Tax=Microtetraspora fusca TaxID=1997 RepID=UPI00082B5EB8|nr:FAD-dependent oxidoreductase [Microtetraspora fusca]
MADISRIAVVGASLAGLRAVQTLRSEGFAGDITLIGEEAHRPYNRPPLSKSVLRGDDDVTLPGAEEIGGEWLRNRRAVRLRLDGAGGGAGAAAAGAGGGSVTLDDGAEIPFDGLVIATGARPRRLAERPGGVHELRTIDDALALRADLAGHRNLVIVGGGFIGGEIASTARALGLTVTLIDAGPYPMHRVLGTDSARWLAAHHRKNGVELISGVRVAGFEGGGRVTGVRLEGGRSIPADLVVAGMGIVPNVEWLEGSGLALDDGVVCTPSLFAEGTSTIVAAGDVARWRHELYGGALVRVEHWANANGQGAVAARNLLAGPESAVPYADVPSFGTHAHGARIQTAGLPHLADEARTVHGAPEEDSFAVAFLRSGVLVGAVGVNAPKELNRLKRGIAAGDVLEVAAS